MRFKSPMLGVALSVFAVVAAASSAPAETFRVGDLVIEAPWARASIGTSRPAAAYMTIRNDGPSSDILSGVETPVSAMAEVHKVEIDDGVSSMGPAGAVAIPAGATVELAPGGLHVMLMKLRRPLEKGGDFALTLIFEKAGRLEVRVPIRGVGAMGPSE